MKKKLIAITLTLVLLFVLAPALPVQAATHELERQVESLNDNCRVTYNDDTNEWNFDKKDVTTAGYYNRNHQEMESGLRFTNITIPRDAEIKRAYLTLTARDNNSANNIETIITGEDTGSADAFDDLSDYQDRNRTDADVPWSFDDDDVWSEAASYRSPNIKSIFQEIVDRSDWGSGNDVVIFWGDDGSAEEDKTCKRAYSYYMDDKKSARLYIEYERATPSYEELPEELETLIEELETLTEELTTQLEELNAQTTELGSLGSSVSKLEVRISELRSIVTNLSSQLSEGFASLGDRLEVVENKLNALEAAETEESALEKFSKLSGKITLMMVVSVILFIIIGIALFVILRNVRSY